LSAACLFLLFESAILIHTRWVEDESWLATEAWTLVQEGVVRMPTFPADPRFQADVSPPVYVYTLAASFRLFGLGIPQARLVSAVAGVGLVIVVFLLASDLAGPLCGMLAALIAATDTFLVVAARTTRAEAENAFLCWLAILLCYWAIQRSSLWFACASGVASGLSMLCHPLSLAVFVSIVLFFFMKYGRGVWKQPLAQVFAVSSLALLVPYLLWCFSDAAHIAGFRDMYISKVVEPMAERILGEADRWSDFIGLSSQRVPLPFRLPLRIHIPIILGAAFLFLYRHNRKLALPALTVLAVTVAWFFYMVNKGPRYLILLAPLFAIVLAYFAAHYRKPRWRAVAIAAFVVVLLTQLASNAYWLYEFRAARYPDVAQQLRRIVPAEASVYGAGTFWLALHDRTYFSFDRTPFAFAIQTLRPRYLILFDRVMMHGSGHGADEFAAQRDQETAFVRSHGILAGSVSNPFYGDLEIYQVSY
jgi:4-amino-4-deoxy-L-arabinose transferase-like glycosyltransferase